VAGGVGELFKRNGGVLTAAELRALGFPRSKLRRFIEDGVLVHKRAGVYTLGKYAAEHQGETACLHALDLAAVLVRMEADCAGSHETAAIIHGLHLLHDPPQSVITLTHPRGGRGTRASRYGVRLHVADLPAGDVVSRFGVPVTSVARTVADLARRGTFQEGVVVTDSALHARLATRADLNAVITSCAGWPGLSRARRAIAFGNERSESVLESLARVIMHDAGLPAPELQVELRDDYGALVARVDFLWPRYRTVGEADGAVKYEKYGLTARQQLERDRKIRAVGYDMVHFDWQGIVYETDRVVGEFWTSFRREQE
jgi:hypothetical protein